MDNKNKNEGSIWGLLPMGVFLVLFLGTGIVTKDFNNMPVNIAFIVAGIVAILMNKKRTLGDKIDTFCRGAGDPNIMLMVLIFLFAGAFANIARDMGSVESTVNLGLSLLPPNILVVGLFLVAMFLSTAIGSSMGTVVSLTPIAVGISVATGIPVAIPVAAVVSGSIFGDNLSMISDTTIAAVRTQGSDMRTKFKMNFLMVIPAVIISIILFYLVSRGYGADIGGVYEYNIIKILPYLGVIILAFTGMNVLVVLLISIIFAGTVGLFSGDFTILTLLASMSQGVINMEDLAMIALLIAGLVEIIKENKGLEFLIGFIGKRVKNKRGAELGIAFLVSIADICTQNNTVSIVMAGTLAKDISEEHGIEPARSAAILDIFACSIQGIVPYGGQLLISAGLASISPMDTLRYNYYPFLLFATGIIVILIGSKKSKDTKAQKVEV